jgi:hypothetical protein
MDNGVRKPGKLEEPIPIPEINDPLYFGCFEQAGHFVWNIDYEHVNPWKTLGAYWLQMHDGVLTPHYSGQYFPDEGDALVHHFGNFTVLAFWDYSVDSRWGSNSMFAIPGHHLDFSEVLVEAKKAFPKIFERFKFEIKDVGEKILRR